MALFVYSKQLEKWKVLQEKRKKYISLVVSFDIWSLIWSDCKRKKNNKKKHHSLKNAGLWLPLMFLPSLYTLSMASRLNFYSFPRYEFLISTIEFLISKKM